MFMATLNAATFMGKNFSRIQSVVKNHEDLTLKQKFDFTAQLVINQEEIHGLDIIQWEMDSWKRLSLVGDEIVINCVSEGFFNIRIPTKFGRTQLQESDPEKLQRFCVINGDSTEFEWNILPGNFHGKNFIYVNVQ